MDCYNSTEKLKFNELINVNIQYIVYNNDKQVSEDAEKIFALNGRVHNIPVINKKGEILYQIDRYSQNTHMLDAVNDILKAASNGSLEYFLKSCGTNREIIITGSDKKFLKSAEKIINTYYNKLISEIGIYIKIMDEIDKICIDDKKISIISLSWFGFMYLWNIKNLKTDIVTAYELVSYSELKKINEYDKEDINAFINIFKYNKILFYCLNNNMVLLKDKLNNYGVKTYNIEMLSDNICLVKNSEDSALNLYLVSGINDNEYIEKITIKELATCLKYIKRYKQLEGKALEYNKFMQSCVFYIKELYNKGFDVFLQSVDSLWEQELHNNINKECEIEIITLWKDISPRKRYIIDKKDLRKPLVGSFIKIMKKQFLIYVCEYSLYSIVKQKCYNVYICSKLFSLDNILYSERNRDNFLINRDFFMDNFVNDITGRDEEYLTQVIRDKAGCMELKVNDAYFKFTSNYHSKYFNTDLYGNRVVYGVPEEYIGTVWILGCCLFTGYAVEDKHTIASYIQEYINLSGCKYRVVNLSCDGGGTESYNKLLERNISINDIVIIQTLSLWNVENLITIDYKELNNALKNKIWFWDIFSHMGYMGYEFLAKKIFNKIKFAISSDKKIYNYKFYLEKELELKIYKYINDTKKILKANSIYKKIYNIYNDNSESYDKPKIGAAVMNCNPFTYGHQYLIDAASRFVNLLYIFVVEEDKSEFQFNDRLDMVKEGVKQYGNIIVIPSGEFMISSVTFPGYFMKDTPTGNVYDDFLDLKIFAHYIAPAFAINTRFVGEEPFDQVTAQYNYDMKVILKEAGIDVIEIPRKKINGEYISATKVRKLLKKKDYTSLKYYLPETTIQKLIL